MPPILGESRRLAGPKVGSGSESRSRYARNQQLGVAATPAVDRLWI